MRACGPHHRRDDFGGTEPGGRLPGHSASSACSTLLEPVVTTAPGQASSFEGLAQLATEPGPTALDILLVHGMCTHDAGWADAAIGQVAAMLGADAPPTVERLAVPHSSAEVFGADLATPQWSVRIAAIIWSPIVAPTKIGLCLDTATDADSCRPHRGTAAPPMPSSAARSGFPSGFPSGYPSGFSPAFQAGLPPRFMPAAPAAAAPGWPGASSAAGTADSLRKRLIDDCMADAVIYLGRARDPINDQMQKALVTAARHFEARRGAATSVSRPLVMITQGLGGKLAFDALLRMQQDYSLSHVGDHLAGRTAQVYLAANQLPFLKLGDAALDEASAGIDGPAGRRRLARLIEAAGSARRTPAPKSPKSPKARIAGMPAPWYEPDPVEAFIHRQAAQRGAARQAPQVVAINDPPDLMAYGTRPERRGDSPIIDVTIEIEPAALGIVVPPDPAYLNYLRDPRVRALIRCGYGQPRC